MLRNDYERGLFNGDQGVVARVSEDGAAPRLRAVFPRGGAFAAFHLDALRPNLEIAFALTVHKSQGSEFDRAVVILPAVDLPLLCREMLYTAITRARKAVVIAGTEALLGAAARRSVERFSGIADRLAGFSP
jgi:exodeoxyribonuclease V alpha subunit